MKRIAALLLLAGLGGGCAGTSAVKAPQAKPFNAASTGKTVPGVVGPTGEPVIQTAATATTDSNVVPAAGFARIVGSGSKGCDAGCDSGCNTGCNTGCTTPGIFRGGNLGCKSCGGSGCSHCSGGYGGYGRGVVPVPPMGPPGAVAAIGAIGPGFGMGMQSNMRTSIRFIGNGKVTWFANGSYVEPGLSMPAEYNFAQANIYRLKVTGLKPGKVYFPTLEVYAATPKSITYLSHGTVPVNFSDEDLARVDSGNMVVKVVYLPDSLYQDVTAIGVDELASTQLDPGTDPIAEAHRRGTILAVIRLGNINLENPNSPAMDAPPQSFGTPGMMPAPGPNMTMSPMPTPSTGPAPLPSIPAAPVSMKK